MAGNDPFLKAMLSGLAEIRNEIWVADDNADVPISANLWLQCRKRFRELFHKTFGLTSIWRTNYCSVK